MDEKLYVKKTERKAATLKFDADVLSRVDAYAKQNRVSRTRFIEVACVEYLERRKDKK